MTSASQPVVIVGVGRSGSTLLHRLISLHPRVAWISGLANRVGPTSRANHRLMVAASIPGLSGLVRSRFGPSEHYDFWERICPGFAAPSRDLRSEDLAPSVALTAAPLLRAAATSRRPVLVLKVTGWPRMGYLDALLRPRFIHIVRDGRAVAASLVRQQWWWGSRASSEWQLGHLPDDVARAWDETGRSLFTLAAIQWRIQTEAVEAARAALDPARFAVVSYEDLCADVTGVVEQIIGFCGLDRDPRTLRALRRQDVREPSERWREQVPAAELQATTPIIAEALARYGYTP